MLAVLTEPNVNIPALLKTARPTSTRCWPTAAVRQRVGAGRVGHIPAPGAELAGPAAGAGTAGSAPDPRLRPADHAADAGQHGRLDGRCRDTAQGGRQAAGATSQAATGRFGQRVRSNLSAYGFLIGAVLCFTFFSWYPIVREVIMSFQKAVYGGGYTWAGWLNYTRIIHDPTFWQAWRNTLEFTLLALVIGYAVPFCVAILLNELRHARGYLRVLVYLPVMLPPASALLLFSYFYNPQYGLFDDILRLLHLPTSQWVFQPGTGFISTAMISVVIASTWMNMGGATLIYLAALQNIPASSTRRPSWTARACSAASGTSRSRRPG